MKKIYKSHVVIAYSVSVGILAACASITDISSLKKGMSVTEAEAILGSPESIISKSAGECRHYRIVASPTYTPTKVVFYDQQGSLVSFGDYPQRGTICPR